MILIIGGAYQGKTSFAKQKFNLSDNEILDGEICTFEALLSAKCVKNYELFLKQAENPIFLTETLCKENPDLTVIMNEIGCGIIPIDRQERQWREEAGRSGCILASCSETVIRLICGIPEIIKGELT